MTYKYALVEGKKRQAEPHLRGTCLTCGSEMVSHCGMIKAWHWQHLSRVTCDPWWEPETGWHRGWKDLVTSDAAEVVIGPHRADILTPTGVVELQHSGITLAEALEREEFYQRECGGMCWLFDALPYLGRVELSVDRTWRDGLACRFRWKHARPVHRELRCPIHWDCGRYGVLRNVMFEFDSEGPAVGYGTLVTPDQFAQRVLGSVLTDGAPLPNRLTRKRRRPGHVIAQAHRDQLHLLWRLEETLDERWVSLTVIERESLIRPQLRRRLPEFALREVTPYRWLVDREYALNAVQMVDQCFKTKGVEALQARGDDLHFKRPEGGFGRLRLMPVGAVHPVL